MAQNQCIFEYSNFGNGYLRIYFLTESKRVDKEIMIDLEKYPIIEGVVADIDPLVDKIKHELNKAHIKAIQNPLLLLRCVETYKSTLFLPIKNYFQAQYHYKKEVKLKHDKDNFIALNNSYKNGVGYIFNTYYIPVSVIESFNKIEKALNTEFVGVQPLGMFLAEFLDFKGNFVCFHIRKKACTMIVVFDNDLITSYDFEIESDKDILNRFLLVATKHEFEVERKQIGYYHIDSDEPYEIDLGVKRFGRIY